MADIPVGSIAAVVPGYPSGLGPLLVAFPPGRSALFRDPQRKLIQDVENSLRRRDSGMALTQYLRSPAAIVLDQEISRQDIILYVANKLGGAHFDRKRERGGMQLLDAQLAVLAPNSGSSMVLAYAELLSIAETLQQSSDATRFARPTQS